MLTSEEIRSKDFEQQRKLLKRKDNVDSKVGDVRKMHKELTRSAELSLARLLEFCGLSGDVAALEAGVRVNVAADLAASKTDSPLLELL